MKNGKLFQYVVMGVFIFFIIVGAILFSTYRSSSRNEVTVNITMWGTLPADTWSSFINRFFSENDLKYTVKYVERDPATFDADLVEALASGTGPDAIILPGDLIVRYTNKIYPIPYASFPELTFRQTFVQEGELYLNGSGVLGLPLMVDPLVMYWNRDIFNNAGVTKAPTTWTDISGLIPQMTKRDQNKNILASTVALGEFRNVNNAKDILSAIIIQSSEDARANTKAFAGSPIVTLNSDGSFASTLKDDFGLKALPATLALEFYTGFSNPNKKEYSWNRSLPSSIDAFANGDLALYFGFASEYLKIKNKNPNLNFDVALLPQIAGTKAQSTFGRIYGLAIMKNSKDPAGTYSVITTLTSASAVPFWSPAYNLPSARRDIIALPESVPAKAIFNKSTIISKGWWDPNRVETSTIFQEMVESYTTGRESLDSAVNTASERLDNLLR
jgi:ABC-type glycerol-3-phosphate transport system substrate-binding protein